MVDLAKESTTMRRVLDPMFIYFDSGRHWVPQQGLALMVLSDILYFMESSGVFHSLLYQTTHVMTNAGIIIGVVFTSILFLR